MKMTKHAAALALLCTLAACGRGNAVVGKWGDGAGEQACAADEVVEFKSDGSITEGGRERARWTADGDRVTITDRGRSMTATVSGDTLTVREGSGGRGDSLRRCPG